MNTGTQEELDFWREFVKTPRFQDWINPKLITPELQTDVVDIIKHESLVGDVLDVGSGVVSILRGLVPERSLIACDLLADDYKRLFDYAQYDITPPKAIAGEAIYFHEMFHIVHMRNALDHTENPVQVWNNLKRAVRLGGLLIVCGFENEATHLHRQGMHQWDISIDETQSLVVTGKAGSQRLQAFPFSVFMGNVRKLDTGRNWVTWIGRKSSVRFAE